MALHGAVQACAEREINESDHQALIDEFIRNVGDAS